MIESEESSSGDQEVSEFVLGHPKAKTNRIEDDVDQGPQPSQPDKWARWTRVVDVDFQGNQSVGTFPIYEDV